MLLIRYNKLLTESLYIRGSVFYYSSSIKTHIYPVTNFHIKQKKIKEDINMKVNIIKTGMEYIKEEAFVTDTDYSHRQACGVLTAKFSL